jgi:hypothetical protein
MYCLLPSGHCLAIVSNIHVVKEVLNERQHLSKSILDILRSVQQFCLFLQVAMQSLSIYHPTIADGSSWHILYSACRHTLFGEDHGMPTPPKPPAKVGTSFSGSMICKDINKILNVLIRREKEEEKKKTT